MIQDPSFTKELFKFLADLRRNNNREWFQANKSRYEQDVKEPALEFVSDFGPAPRRDQPPLPRRPEAGRRIALSHLPRRSLLERQVAVQDADSGFTSATHSARTPTRPATTSTSPRPVVRRRRHLAPGLDDAGARSGPRFAAEPEGLAALGHPGASVRSRLRWAGGDSLKRAPTGYDPDHPLIEDLKRKDFVGYAMLDEKTVTADGFLDEYTRICRSATPFVEFLCRAVGAPF